MIGQTISHYKILEKLGEGGMGVVYKALDTKLDRVVALKFLPHHLMAEETERSRFLQEAKAAATLNHPNICTIHGIEEADGQQFIEMEFIDGVTLRHKIPVEKLDGALGYAIQIGEALEEAHAKGVVHRDIKADNIMVNSKNQIKVMDFGLAKLKGSLKLTRTSSTVGTLAYMSPEQIQGGEVDSRSDIFSFGIVFYEMLTGRFPFKGEHEAAMMYSIINEEADPIENYRPDISAEVVHILNRALEKDIADRYQSVSDMLIDLRRVKKQSTKVVRTGVHQVSRTIQSSSVLEPTVLSSSGKKRNLVIGTVVVFIAASLLIWKLFLTGEGESDVHPFQSFKPVRLSTDAMPTMAAISPDGKYIIYSVDESGKRSVWMRQVSASSSVRILPPDEVNYQGFTFSPDGDNVYYSVISKEDTRGVLKIVPTLGGTPRKVIDNLTGGVAVSPDGKQLAFIRSYPDNGEEALMICAVDGTNERKLLSRTGEDFFLGNGGEAPSWSPDGATIAIPAGSTKGNFHMNVLLVSVTNGSFRLATPNYWKNVGRITWVNNGKGIAIAGVEYLTGLSPQLWYVNILDGSYYRITSDLMNYNLSSLNTTSSQSTLLTLQQSFNSSIEIFPAGDWRRTRKITARNTYQEGINGMNWTPDGKIVYSSLVSGYPNLWIINPENKDRTQLTSNHLGEFSPNVSNDGQFIAYISENDTTPHTWVMNIDGNNQRRLTTGMDDYLPQFSPDNQWIYFDSYRDKGRRNLWKIPMKGGDPVKVTDKYIYNQGFSPDGLSILVRVLENNKWSNVVLSLESDKIITSFELPVTATTGQMRWMPDGKGIAYVDTRNGVSNIWVMNLATKKSNQLTHFESELIGAFAWSKDGKNLAIVHGEQTSDIVLLSDVK